MKKKMKKAAKTKVKAKSKAKPKMIAKAKSKVKAKAKGAKKTAPRKASKGLSVVELYQLKKQKEQAAQDPEAWKHKKDLPPQDQPHHEDPDRAGAGAKKSGFGGIRHH